ncbi:hypothetical protein PHJA_001763100 [Phtheirospermum japonicum]|uniref:Uncharacterized protein n=1 Tax=Phtheirospermum japonicum TaxID=374723 RepID=A0A830C9D3_9LAMI|nr:hypothetical protein PHJA_001763100 [Phtheirospermum japonicum]
MMIILCKLDARSVALARLVSAGWLAVGSDDEIWAPKVLFSAPSFRFHVINCRLLCLCTFSNFFLILLNF